MKRIILSIMVFAAMVLATLAVELFASVSSAGTVAKRTVYRRTQSVDFDATDVDGIARSPDGAYVQQKKGIKFLPLYNVNQNFDQAIKRSIRYVK